MNFPFIYLASASPRRHEILLQMGVEHEVLHVPSPPGEDEPRLDNEPPHVYVQRTAREKAERAVHWLNQQQASGKVRPGTPILSADTTVILEDQILGKPADQADAASMLRRLSGRKHAVHTAVVLAHAGQLHEAVSITEVHFKPLTEQEISLYCASGEPMGKAGAYGIQGKAGMFVTRIIGSHTGVVGLPVYETGKLLSTLVP